MKRHELYYKVPYLLLQADLPRVFDTHLWLVLDQRHQFFREVGRTWNVARAPLRLGLGKIFLHSRVPRKLQHEKIQPLLPSSGSA